MFFALVFSCLATTAFAGQTVSVLKTEEPTVATDAQASCGCAESARLVRLGPWRMRRLNRLACRQEARDARNCCDCCNSCEPKCESSCGCKPRLIVVEPRRTKCCNGSCSCN